MTEEFKQYIDGLARCCKGETFHGEYQSKVKFSSEAAPEDDAQSSTRMSVHFDTVYLFVTITIYPQCEILWENKNYVELGDCMMHEFCHGFLEPVVHLFMWDVPSSQKKFVRDTIERQTQRICNSLIDLLPKTWANPETLMAKGFIKVDPFSNI